MNIMKGLSKRELLDDMWGGERQASWGDHHSSNRLQARMSRQLANRESYQASQHRSRASNLTKFLHTPPERKTLQDFINHQHLALIAGEAPLELIW